MMRARVTKIIGRKRKEGAFSKERSPGTIAAQPVRTRSPQTEAAQDPAHARERTDAIIKADNTDKQPDCQSCKTGEQFFAVQTIHFCHLRYFRGMLAGALCRQPCSLLCSNIRGFDDRRELAAQPDEHRRDIFPR